MSNGEDEWNKLDNLPSIALREAYLWGQAVFRLSGAISQTQNNAQAQIDAMLVAVAYRNVHRAARMALRAMPQGQAAHLDRVLAHADKLAPDARSVRDMLEHFDDYEQGAGHLQQPGTPRSDRKADEELARSHLIFFRRAGTDFTLVVGAKSCQSLQFERQHG